MRAAAPVMPTSSSVVQTIRSGPCGIFPLAMDMESATPAPSSAPSDVPDADSTPAASSTGTTGSDSGSYRSPSRATQTMSRCACRATRGRCSSPGVAGTSNTRSSAAFRRTAKPRSPAQATRRSQTACSWPDGRGTEQSSRKFPRKSSTAAAAGGSSGAVRVALQSVMGHLLPCAFPSCPRPPARSSRAVRGGVLA